MFSRSLGLRQRYLMAMQRVQKPPLHQVQDLQGRIVGGGDEEVPIRVKGQTVHCCTVHCGGQAYCELSDHQNITNFTD